MAFNFGPEMKVSSIQLILVLTCLTGPMIGTLMLSEPFIEPLQVSETTWHLLECDFPDAVFVDVSFLNSTHGWIAGRATSEYGSNAIVLHTEDGGNTWELQSNQSSQRISIMDVVDNKTIWINGLGSLFYTLDGGNTWNESVVVGGDRGMSTVKFINKTLGWTSNNGLLYQTVDGGESWEPVSGFTFDDSPRMIQALTHLDIWAIGFTGIYHSTDGGMIWEKVSEVGGWALSFVSEAIGWAVADDRFAHTIDGHTWHELSIPGRSLFTDLRFGIPYLSDVQFIDENNGWIVSTEIPVMYTPDGGTNWYEQSVPSEVNDRIRAVDFINQTHGWAVGWDGIIMRTRTGNDLGNQLWTGMTDPMFLFIVIVSAIAVTGVLVIYWFRKKRITHETKLRSPSIE
ncbi:MAG: YCF48-related protein [Candidatus Thorarchaeota archaeon]